MNAIGTLSRFCRFVGVDDPDALIRLSPQEASRLVQEFIDHLNERGPREVNDRLNRIERALEDLRKNSEGSSIVTITEPIRDEQGRLITSEDGKPIYKIVKGPANVVGVSDFRDRLLEKLALERFEGRSSGESPNVIIREPLRDADGRIVTGEDGKPLYRIIQGPPSVVGAVGTDFRDRLLEKVVLEQTKPKSELTPEDIRKIIRDEMRSRETTPKETVSKEDLERFKKDTVESVKKIFEERETEGRLARIEKDLKDIKTGAAGHMSEEGRIKLTTITEGIDAIEKQMANINRTITNLVNTIPKLLRKEAPEGTRVPVLEAEIERAAEKLEEKVGEVVERPETVA